MSTFVKMSPNCLTVSILCNCNNPSKKQCSSCQVWRGGSRKGYSISAIYAAWKRKKREVEEEEEGVMAAGGRRRWDGVECKEKEEEGRE